MSINVIVVYVNNDIYCKMHLTKIIQLEGKQDYTKITRLSDYTMNNTR